MCYLICLPTYNEASNVAFMIEELRRFGYKDIIISDARSEDGTADIARNMEAVVLTRSGHGKGFAIKDALFYAQENNFEALILLDCDRTYPVSAIKELISSFSSADMVVACRNFKDISFLRRMANHLMTAWTNLFFNPKVKDMATGMRMLRVEKFVGRITAKSFDVEPQMHCLALKNKWRIKEIDISYQARVGESKINLGHLFLILYRVLAERFKN
jgi:glycosyltransferase involved in cell wall biosynthesis